MGMADADILMLIHSNDLMNDKCKPQSMDTPPSKYQLLHDVPLSNDDCEWLMFPPVYAYLYMTTWEMISR